ncbi:MAG TPA: autotransporter-associated beta strand repeat-containing protein, partial [Caulobacteraceae bacterium]|nr:autotransporter-associated beta strand repeat-containing protein [Caulobacteraceae bacterium]
MMRAATMISNRRRALALSTSVSSLALLALAGQARADTVDNATVTVPGSQSSPWTVSSLVIGVSGTAEVDVGAGGLINTVSCGPINLGQNTGSSGTLKVQGAGAKVDNGACGIAVGQSGSGVVVVGAGGELDTLNTSTLGGAATSTGTVTVTGTGSKWAVGPLAIAANGTGTVNVLAGGLVTQSGCGSTNLGSGFSGVGTINVDGTGSHWAGGACNLFVGDDGQGVVNVTGGGVIDGLGEVDLGRSFNTSQGALTVSGAGSKFISTNNIYVGEFGVGALTINSGGLVSDGNSDIGDLTGSVGTASVDGAGTKWVNTGTLGVGRNGTGSLSVTNGAVVTSDGGFFSAQGGGTLTVSGAGSAWNSTNSLDLGSRGTSTINITAGGVISDTFASAGTNSNASPTIVIDGAGSAWTNSSSLSLGGGFNSGLNLTVSNGGLLSDTAGTLGTGTVKVAGSGSTWTNSSLLRIGASGPGVLTIAQQGAVTATGGVILGQSSSSSGILNIGGAVGQPANSPGDLNAPTIVLGAANGAQGTLNFNHNSVSYLFTPVISGPGKVNVVSGLTIFNQDETYTGLTTISPGAYLQIGNGPAAGSIVSNVQNDGTLYFIRGGVFSYNGTISGSGSLHMFSAGGTLKLFGSHTYTGGTFVDAGALQLMGVLGATNVSVGSTAILTGNGTIGGSVSIANSGVLQVQSGNQLRMGDLVLAPAAFLNATLFGPGATSLVDAANVTLDGTLNVTDGGGFGPGLYRLINYTGTLTDNGLNLGTLPGGVQASNLQVQTSVAGQVNLVYASNAVATPFWNGSTTSPTNQVVGGAGTWKLGPTNWTDANGATSGPWDGTTAIFAGTAGAVTIDNSAGQVGANAVQFAVDGDSVGGGSLSMTGATPIIRVGDGTAAGAGYTATISAPITGSNGFTKTDLGRLILTGTNTYTGTTTISGGYVSVGSDANLGAPAASLALNGGGLIATGTFASTRAVSVTGAGEIRTNQGQTLTLGGAMSGSGALTKSGLGTLALNTSGAFTGTVDVTAGGLVVGATLQSPTVTVESGASLAGTGAITGSVTVKDGGVLVGTQGSTLTIGTNLVLSNQSNVDVTLGAPSSTRLFNVQGALTLDGQLNVTNAGAFGQGLYRLIDYTGALTDNGLTLGTLPSGFQAGQFSVQTSIGGQVNLIVAAPPATPFWNGAT